MKLDLTKDEISTIHDALCSRWDDIESGERYGDYDADGDGKIAKAAIETVQKRLFEAEQ